MLTHELVVNSIPRPGGMGDSDCPGELAHRADYLDHRLGPDGRVTRSVTTFECSACRATLVVADEGAGWTLVNVYRLPPRRLVATLAESIRYKGREHPDDR